MSQQQELKLAISLPRRVRVGDGVVLVVSLTNSASEARLVNARLLLNPDLGELRPTVTRDGDVVHYEYMENIMPVQAGSFLELQPGEAVVGGRLLSNGFDLSRAGDYQVQVRYVSEVSPAALAGRPLLLGRVSSPVARFCVHDGPQEEDP